MKTIAIGTQATKQQQVNDEVLASHVGSGIVDVYATPMMIALMEATACECLAPFLEDGETSVGVMMNTTHDAATPVGMMVTVTAEITAVDRKKISFSIIARDEVDTIGVATHDRFLVIKDKFEARANAKGTK